MSGTNYFSLVLPTIYDHASFDLFEKSVFRYGIEDKSIGFFVNNELLLELIGINNFAPLQEPVLAAPGNNNSENTYNLHYYKFADELYKTQQKAVSGLTNAMKRCLSEANRNALLTVFPPPLGMLQATGIQLLDALREIYGTVKPDELDAELEKLKTPYDESLKMSDHIALHTQIHATYRLATGENFSNLQKIDVLRKTLPERFFPVHERFLVDIPQLRLRTYDTFIMNLLEYAQNHVFSAISMHGYSAIAAAVIGPSMEDIIEEHVKAAVALALFANSTPKRSQSVQPQSAAKPSRIPSTHRNANTILTAQRTITTPAARGTKFCYTHGICNHDTSLCKYPNDLHIQNGIPHA
jgi:hypothetical protein